MSAENLPASPVTVDNLPTNKGSGGLTAKEFAAIQLRSPTSGTEWLDKMIRESNYMTQFNALHVELTDAFDPVSSVVRAQDYMRVYAEKFMGVNFDEQ